MSRVCWLLLIGILLFSGSLYALAITGVRTLGAVTPIGGTAFIVAWVMLGWELALAHVIVAVLFFITIIGIPFGVANLKLARLALLPFGFEVADASASEVEPIVTVPQLGPGTTTGSVTTPD